MVALITSGNIKSTRSRTPLEMSLKNDTTKESNQQKLQRNNTLTKLINKPNNHIPTNDEDIRSISIEY